MVNAERIEDLIAVFGSFDENMKRIEEALNVQIVNRGTDLKVTGDEEMVDKAVRTLEGLLSLASKGRHHRSSSEKPVGQEQGLEKMGFHPSLPYT